MEFLGHKYTKHEIPLVACVVFFWILLILDLSGNININVSDRLWGITGCLCALLFAYSGGREIVKKKKKGERILVNAICTSILSVGFFIWGLRTAFGLA